MRFHNPYHFVPVKEGKRETDLTREQFDNDPGHVTHDRYVPGTHSGRLICRITTETPIFIGSSTDPSQPNQPPIAIKPYELDGLPAIPATTLRGLISSIAEAASNSAMRVLEDEHYSFRQIMEESLSAIGMIFEEGGKFRLRPLTLPTIAARNPRPLVLPAPYAGLYPFPNLKVYLGIVCSPYQSFTDSDPKFYYLKLKKRSWNTGLTVSRDNHLKWRQDTFLLAQRPLVEESPIAEDDLAPLLEKEYTRGILRVLGSPDRDMPDGRYHELFIPYPAEPNNDADDWPTFEILDEAVERFHAMADERTEASKKGEVLPYHPIGTIRNPKEKDNNFRLKTGDLVYFRPSERFAKTIAEISLSSIWRSRVETGDEGARQPATTRSFFRRINKELLPFGPEREVITTAEQMFGFVAQGDEEDGKQSQSSLALMGRLFPAPARMVGIRAANGVDWEIDETGLRSTLNENGPHPAYQDWVTLKILASPKPPSPSMYFKAASGEGKYIAKRKLHPDFHAPQGRGFFLHKQSSQVEPWRSTNPLDPDTREQKVTIRPIKPRAVFYFHIDFDNLSDRELGLLLYALRPTEQFRHKLGMGKPLGLGTVRIDPVGLFCVDRVRRYSAEGLVSPRYSHVWRAGQDMADFPWPRTMDFTNHTWPDRYAFENGSRADTMDPGPLHGALRDSMDNEIRYALELIGDPRSVTEPVHNPVESDQPRHAEEKTYRWYTTNDVGKVGGRAVNQQFLKPIAPTDTHLHLGGMANVAGGTMPILESHQYANETPPRVSDLVFFLGGQDLEMKTIKELLSVAAPGQFKDKSLAWGAKASDYAAEINDYQARNLIPVLIELKQDIDFGNHQVKVIDHHGEQAGHNRLTSLHQVFELLNLPARRWTRWHELVAANDRGYIPEMQKLGATEDEIRKIREEDRKAQGITPEHEAKAAIAVAAAELHAGEELTVVNLPHSRTAAVTDLLASELGGPGYRNLLIVCPEEFDFYGPGHLVATLARKYPDSWYGGALPERGFWGNSTAPDILEFLTDLLTPKP